MILQDDDSWKISVREKYLPLVQKIVADTELSKATLETLAVIAYKSPVLQSEVIKIRGSGAYDHISDLLKLGFMTREKAGRSFKLKLAEKFFEYFDVEGAKDIKEALKDAKQPVDKPDQKKLGELDIVDVPKEEAEPETTLEADESLPDAKKDVEEAEEKETNEEATSEDDDNNTQEMLEEVEKEIDELTKNDAEIDSDSEETEDDESEEKDKTDD